MPSRDCASGAVAAIQVDIVARRVSDVEAQGVADDERDGFGFELARVTRARPIARAVEEFVCLCHPLHKRTYVL